MEAIAHPLFTSTKGLAEIATNLPNLTLISIPGKIADMIRITKDFVRNLSLYIVN
jgi:hypothetical protein